MVEGNTAGPARQRISMRFKQDRYQTNGRCLILMPAALIFALMTGCTEPSAHPAPDPQAIFEENRNSILQCAQVCRISGWYFTSVSLKQTGSKNSLVEKGKLEAAARILTFIDDPETYDRLYGDPGQQAGSARVEKSLSGKLQLRVVASGPVQSSQEPRYGVTVAAKEVQQ